MKYTCIFCNKNIARQQYLPHMPFISKEEVSHAI